MQHKLHFELRSEERLALDGKKSLWKFPSLFSQSFEGIKVKEKNITSMGKIFTWAAQNVGLFPCNFFLPRKLSLWENNKYTRSTSGARKLAKKNNLVAARRIYVQLSANISRFMSQVSVFLSRPLFTFPPLVHFSSGRKRNCSSHSFPVY